MIMIMNLIFLAHISRQFALKTEPVRLNICMSKVVGDEQG